MSKQPRVRARFRGFRGFTLIELLVVVAIIALLISILLPSLSRARAMGRMVKCQANQKQFNNANMMYADANEQKYVPILHRWPGAGYWDRIEWFQNGQYRSFLGVRANMNANNESTSSLGDGILCPDTPDPYKANNGRNYAFQWYLGPNIPSMEGVAYPSAVWGSIGPHIRRSKVVSPAMKFQMIDSSDWHVPNPNYGNYINYWDLYGEAVPPSGKVTYRHSEGANLSFFDGHGEYLSKFEVYNQTDTVARNRLWAIYE